MICWFISSLSFGPGARDCPAFILLDECVCRSRSLRAASLLGRSSGVGQHAEVFASVACLPLAVLPAPALPASALAASWCGVHPSLARGLGAVELPGRVGSRGWVLLGGHHCGWYQEGWQKAGCLLGSGCCTGDLPWVSPLLVAEPLASGKLPRCF